MKHIVKSVVMRKLGFRTPWWYKWTKSPKKAAFEYVLTKLLRKWLK